LKIEDSGYKLQGWLPKYTLRKAMTAQNSATKRVIANATLSIS